MKKAFFLTGLALTSALFLSGCQRETDFSTDGTPMDILLTMEDTRTVNYMMSTFWVEDDPLSVFCAPAGSTDYSANTCFSISNPTTGTASGAMDLTEGDYDWYLLYPHYAGITSPEGKGEAVTIGGTEQIQTRNSNRAHLAGENLPLYGVARGVPYLDTPHVTMHQVATVIAVHVTNGTGGAISVKRITLTAPFDIVGSYYLDFSKEGNPGFTAKSASETSSKATLLVSNGDYLMSGGDAFFYLAVKPFSLAPGDWLKLEIEAGDDTTTATVIKEITLTEVVSFQAGHVKNLNISFDKEPDYVARERAALEAFYRSNDGDNWYHRENWCTDKPLREWYGVSTDYRGHVTRIDFWNNNLHGYIPKEIGDLTELEALNLTNNGTMLDGYGPIPEEIGNLKKLQSLQLQSYNVSGRIPESLSNLTELETLLISNPRYLDTDPFPQGLIGKFRKLRYLSLYQVDMAGHSLSDFGDLYDLEYLRLVNNNLTGSIPESFGNLQNLKDADLSSNGLSGAIPSSLRTVDNYWRLWPGFVSGNLFTMEDLRASACPAPRSPKLQTLSGKTLDLEQEFKTHDYTVLVQVQWTEGLSEFFQQLEQLREANPGLGVVSYFENNSEEEAEKKRRDDEFKTFLESCHAGWESFIRYWSMIYPEDEAPLYCTPGAAMYPGGNNNVVVVGPENTVVFTTLILGNMSGNKHEAVIEYLEDVLASPLERYESSDYSADKTVTTLQQATVGKGVDLVITGDAFSDRLIADGTFERLARNAADNFFSAEPMKSLRDRFNVYLVNAVSRNEEYFNGCSTVFSGAFGYGSAVGGNNDEVLSYTRAAIPAGRMDNALTLVLMNSSKSGGTCYMLEPEDRSIYAAGASIAWLPYKDASAVFGQSGTASTLVHELAGHGLGKLADEYYYFGMGEISEHSANELRELHKRHWYVNVDVTDILSEVCWSRFIGDDRYADEGIGVYQGGFVYEFGVWRPTDNSIMFRSGSPDSRFNAPSRAQLYTRIMKLSEGESWQFDYEAFVSWDKAHPDKKAAQGRNKVENGIEEHVPPVIVHKTWREAAQRR